MTFSYDPAPEKASDSTHQVYLSEFKPMSEPEFWLLGNRLWPTQECQKRIYNASAENRAKMAGIELKPMFGNCEPPRPIEVVVHQTLTEFSEIAQNFRFAGKFVVTAAVVYEDPLFKRELHHFSLGTSASEPVAVASSTGATAAAVHTLPNDGPTAEILSPPADQLAETVQSPPTMANIATDTQSPLTHIIDAGQREPLIGAQNVLVNGTLYDVTFLKGTCVDVFDGCDQLTDFMINDAATARAAAEALLDQVFVDGFDTNPYSTYGSFRFSRNSRQTCTVHVPYRSNVTGGFGQVSTGVAINWNLETMDHAAESGVWAHMVHNWARFVRADQN